jgi:hypothetical protein
MVLASHYVIKSISIVLEKKDLTESEDVCDKFSRRYVGDEELQRICNDFKSYLSTRDDEELEKIKLALKKLKDVRKRETSGGTRLWYKDRRPGVMQLIRIT